MDDDSFWLQIHSVVAIVDGLKAISMMGFTDFVHMLLIETAADFCQESITFKPNMSFIFPWVFFKVGCQI